ncbi:MAG: zeta toxin family protein [Flavobacteriaceae bacterium]
MSIKKHKASEKEIQTKALQWIKRNKHKLLEKFASDDKYLKVDRPISVFMAGSPGAGKTEFSKMLIEKIFSNTPMQPLVRIDPDEIREMIPNYTGGNAYLFQQATDRAVHELHNYCLRKGKNFILDGTLYNYQRAEENISRSLKRDREVIVFYLYLNPYVAWDITQKREVIEGRKILKEDFITKLFASRATIKKIKKKFGTSIQLWAVKKRSVDADDFKHWDNIDIKTLDKHVNIPYNEDQLKHDL